MKYSTFEFRYKDLDIDLTQIEKVLGYGEGEDREIVKVVIEGILNEPELFSNIRAEYKIYKNIEFVNADKSLNINDINLQTHKLVFGQLNKADSLAVFLCTAGEEIGIRVRKAMAGGDPLTGYIYDIIGSIVVDAAADRMQGEIEKSILSEGKKITNRYSPGYCGWHVREQQQLFSLFPQSPCGVKLNDSSLMFPIKSVSGIIGIGANIESTPYACEICGLQTCFKRKM